VLADPVFDKDDARVRMQKVKAQAIDAPKSSAESKSNLSMARLPFSRREADAILAIVPAGEGMPALNFQASRATAISPEMSQYRILHFATHGVLDSQRPELSAIVLSLVDEEGQPQNGFIRLNEIYNLNLPADLVMLSACQTGLGKEIRGEGLVGLTRGFMYAGAARVGTSLWKVDDSATATLMAEFLSSNAKGRKIPCGGTQSGATRYVETKALAIALLLGGVHHAGRMEINAIAIK
jgi:CHAT domain-containing protein